MAISYDDITAGSNQTVYNFNFDYIEASDVKVKLNGNDTTAYTLSGAKQVTLDAAPTQGTVVRVYRETNSLTPEKNFVSGSTLKAEELNANFKQALYVTQETTREVAESNAGNVITQVTNAVNTANAASTAATNAENTANGIAATANTALTTANTASTNASTALTNVASKADIGANVSIFANDSNYISKGTNNTLPADIIIDSTQNITTTGSLTAGTTTTGTTTTGSTSAQNLTVSGNATFNNGISTGTNKDVYTNNGAFIASDAGGAFADRSSNNIDHIWHDESDNAWNFVSDDPYKAAGNSKIKAGSFYGDGSNLTGLITGVRQVKEGSSTGTSSRTSSTYATKASVSLTNTASTSRVLVISTYKIWGSTPYSAGTTSARTTRGNDSTFSGDTYDTYSNSGGSSSQYSPSHTSFLWDVSTSSGTREYKIRYNRSGNGTGYISNARIMAIEFRPT